jgi:hypothetical protein
MSAPTVLPAAVVAHLAGPPVPAREPARFLRPALVRSGLLLTPVAAAAAGGALPRVPWPVVAGLVAAAWCTTQPLSHLGRLVAVRAAPRQAARLVLAGFALVAAGCAGVLAAVPGAAGADRAASFAVAGCVLAAAATSCAAVVTRAEGAVLCWLLPVWLLTGLVLVPQLAGGSPPRWLAGPAVLAALLPAAVRAFRPALPALPARPAPLTRPALPAPPAPDRVGGGLRASLTFADLRRSGGWLVLALGQSAAVLVVWRASAAVTPLPVTLATVVVAVPLIECHAGWHLTRVAAGLAGHDDRLRYLRHVRRLGWTTLAAPLPPLLAGVAIAGSAGRLPYRLSAHPDAGAVVLAGAAGVLLAGLLAVAVLVAVRGRPGLAGGLLAAPAVGAALAAAVPALAAASLSGWGRALPAVVVGLVLGYAAGAVAAATTVFDPRSRR